MFITGGLRPLTAVVDETPVLGLFIGVTDTLVEADIHELCTTDGDGLGCMKEVGLLNTGGLGSLAMAVDETPGTCAGMANTLDDTGGAECVTIINGGLVVLPDKGGAHSKDVGSTDDDLLSENPSSISSVSLASKSVMAATFLASASLKSASVFRDSSLMMAFSSSSSASHIRASSRCFLFSSNIFISSSILCCFSCSAKARAS